MRTRLPLIPPSVSDTGRALRPTSHRRIAGTVGVVSLASFVLLTYLVAAHLTEPVDMWMKERLRPHDEWGDLQVRVDVIVEGLKPRNASMFLGVLLAGTSLARRSWRPVIFTVLVGILGA